jgi:hypothetical protein
MRCSGDVQAASVIFRRNLYFALVCFDLFSYVHVSALYGAVRRVAAAASTLRQNIEKHMLKTILTLLTFALIAFLSGCHNLTPAQESHLRGVESNLKSASERTTVICPDRASCERGWAATQSYVLRNSNTEIRLLNASVIDTYLPDDDGAAALSAWRSSTPGGQWFIRIDGMCGGMYDGDTHWPGPAFDECALKLVTAFDQFPGYLKRSWVAR